MDGEVRWPVLPACGKIRAVQVIIQNFRFFVSTKLDFQPLILPQRGTIINPSHPTQ
jgi:hypothetical protein